ncbi:MAG: hypothetical protein LBS19_13190 [Clostridiales bacterium]|jgi:outer membrane biosynthesis protein TonB|nr:hypothetical protein [Clostridiales bacterium]
MPKRPILFGVGAGIVFSCLALYFIYTNQLLKTAADELSAVTETPFLASAPDEVTPTVSPDIITPSITPETSTPEIIVTPMPVPTQEPTIEPTLTPEPIQEPTPTVEPIPEPAPTIEPTQVPAFTDEPTPESTQAPGAISGPPAQGDSIRVTIPDGRTATQVSRLLQDAGVIDSAEDFLAVLREKGYTVRLSSGTFTLTTGMGYDELAERIVRR